MWLPLLLGVGMALAVLTKGLIGLVVPGATAVLYVLIYRDPRRLLRARQSGCPHVGSILSRVPRIIAAGTTITPCHV